MQAFATYFRLAGKSTRCMFLLGLLTLGVLPVATVSGQTSGSSASVTSSLDLVPDDAAFYFATLNHQKIWKQVVESQAYQQLLESPVNKKLKRAYRKGLSRGWDQFGESPLRHYLEGYANSIDSIPGKLVMPYLERMFAHEFFLFADQELVRTILAIQRISSESRPLLAAANEANVSEDELLQKFLGILETHLRDVQVPTLIMGSIVEEPEVFIGMLDLMETGLAEVKREAPPEALEMLNRIQSHRGEGIRSLAFELKCIDLPWDALAGGDSDLEELLPVVRKLLADKTLAVGICIQGQALTMSLSSDFDRVTELAQGKKLVDRPEFADVAAARRSGQPLVSVSYISEDFATATASDPAALIETLSTIMIQAIREVENDRFSEPQRGELAAAMQKDLKELGQDLARFVPRPGAQLSYSFLTDQGIEGFVQDHSQRQGMDGSAPIAIRRHAGSAPFLVIANRSQDNAEQTAMVQKYGSRAIEYAERYLPRLTESDEEADRMQHVLEQLIPILRKVGTTTTDKLIPQTAGLESGLLIDLNSARTSWHPAMPAANHPLPIPALAVIAQIRDATQIKEAGAEYLDAAADVLNMVKNLSDGEVPPELEIPVPQHKQLPDGEMFYFPLPAEVGLDPAIAPHAVLNEQWLVLGYLEDFSTQLLPASTAEFFGPAGEEQPAMAITYLDTRQLFKAIRAWRDYGFDQWLATGEPLELREGSATDLHLTEQEIRDSIEAALNFLGCWQGYSGRSFQQDGVQTHHFLFKFQDVPKK